MAKKDKVVLAYSGGLDTSVAVRWIQDTYKLDVVTLTIDLGTKEDLETIRKRALEVGAVKAVVVDATDLFVEYFVWPALQAGALYEGVYPLATALGRPAHRQAAWWTSPHQNAARSSPTAAPARATTRCASTSPSRRSAPELNIIAPAREWGMTREEEIDYAAEHGIPIPVTKKSPYSTDENLWGRSIECGVLEDPWAGAARQTPTPGPRTRPTRRTSRPTSRSTSRRACPSRLDGERDGRRGT